MAPSTASQSTSHITPPSDTGAPLKRSLRSRGANVTAAAISPQVDGMGGDSDKDGGGKPHDFDGGPNDARGK